MSGPSPAWSSRRWPRHANAARPAANLMRPLAWAAAAAANWGTPVPWLWAGSIRRPYLE
jgi:hypothetical protein